MVRPLRLEFSGAVYHITSRGDRKEDIYSDDEDRTIFLELFGDVCCRYNWIGYAYCLMTNHYHLVIETPDANLSSGMRQLNGVYTQRFNRRHKRVGHVFQGRFHAVLVQKGSHLLEITRYVVLNPVRAGMVSAASLWPWSSHCTILGQSRALSWLHTDWILAQFAVTRQEAVTQYTCFINAGLDAPNPWRALKHQTLLGDNAYVAAFRDPTLLSTLGEIPKTQRQFVARELADYRASYIRDEAMALAYLSGAYTMKKIGDFFGVHYMTVSRAVEKHEQKMKCET